jgi:hypothetical protein
MLWYSTSTNYRCEKAVKFTVKIAHRQSQLNVSIAIYKNTCHKLIGPLNLPDSQMTALLDERQAEAWSDTDLQAAIKVRLGDNHSIYASLQDKLNKRILLLCQKLELEPNGQPPWVASDGNIDEKARKKFFTSFRRRTKGGFNTGKYRNLLNEIDRDIEKLSKLANGAIQLEPVKIQKRNNLQSAYWQEIRDHAQRISDKLSVSFSPCDCTHPHQANLRLDLRENCGKERDASRFTFQLTFGKDSHPASSPPWDWRDIGIECSRPVGETIAVAALQSQMSGKADANLAPSISVSPPLQRTIPRSPSSDRAREIGNLCRVLVTAHGHGQECYLGVLEDGFWQHHIYSVPGPATKAQMSGTVSLYDMIHQAKKMAPRQKCTLALTLASSVLQLHDTPWLPRTWSTKDILFLENSDGGTIPSQFYASQTFTSESQSNAAVKHRRVFKNEVVFTLGVALLELAYGSSILSLKEPEDLNDDGKVDSMTEFSIASRLARELIKYESENYARAVFRCVNCTFDTFASDFDDKEFREAFYQAVVVPLLEDYEYVTNRNT